MDANRRRTLTLVATIIGSGIALLDSTIVNVALPAIEDDLGGGLAGQQWVANAYLLTLGSLILLGGTLGDVYGPRRIFIVGVLSFGIASLLCAVAPNVELLVVARALQGVTSALLTPASLALIAAVYDDEQERGAAIGTWTAFGAIAAVIGPVAGGWIVDVATWRWVFAINVPFVLAALVLAHVTRDPAEAMGGKRRRIDLVGAATAALGLAGPVYALIEQPSRGWADPTVIAGLVGGALLLTCFVVYERRASQPMLPCGLFARRNFTVANIETLLVYAGLSSLFFFLTIYLQQVAGYSALESGLASAPAAVILFVVSRRVGRLSMRIGPRLFMGIGPLIGAAGVALLVRLDEHPNYVLDVLPPMILFGIGLSLMVAPLTATVMSAAHRGDSGIASGVNNAIARVAGLLGIAVVGVAVAARSGAELDLDGFRMGMALTAAIVAAGGVVGLVGIRNPAQLAPPEASLVSSAR
jgi:EmrB/QacA subfamily drug resistance transporter